MIFEVLKCINQAHCFKRCKVLASFLNMPHTVTNINAETYETELKKGEGCKTNFRKRNKVKKLDEYGTVINSIFKSMK